MTIMTIPRICCLCSTLMLMMGSSTAFADNARSLAMLQKRYETVSTDFQREMETLALFCETQSFFTDAERIRARSLPAIQQALDLDELPVQVQPQLPPDLPDLEQQWRVKLQKLELDYAAALYKLSRDALGQGHVSLAFQLIREVAFHDPDHKFARSMLGYQRVQETWTTPFAATMSARGLVYHETYGWLPKTHVSRYENGERNYNGNWISADREATLRSDFKHAWEVTTEHFVVRTNHSLEVGVQIGQELELFHKYFVREFAAFFNTPAQMQRLFDKGEAGTNPGKRYNVFYFRTKQDFVQHLIQEQPNIGITNGLYLPRKRIAYFFHNPEQEQANLETMFHEVTHQLLSESSTKTFDVAPKGHFWLVEGIACYIESYQREGDLIRIGNPQHPRFYWARERLVKENEYYEFQSFSSLGLLPFQQAGNVATLQKYYAQAASMTHFYINYNNGIYRDALLTHLSEIYSPIDGVRFKAQGMDQLTGVPYDQLQQQYREYMTGLIVEPTP